MRHFKQVLAEAHRALKKDGDLPLTAMGFDLRGRGFKIWMHVEKDEDKERFTMALAGNLMVHSALEYYLVFTGWMVRLDKEEEIQTRPSQDPRRREVMIVYGETHDEREAKLYVIERDRGGRLLNFKERPDLNEMIAENGQMRFSGLLGPKRNHTPEERERMRALLKPMPSIFHIHGPEPLINPALN